MSDMRSYIQRNLSEDILSPLIGWIAVMAAHEPFLIGDDPSPAPYPRRRHLTRAIFLFQSYTFALGIGTTNFPPHSRITAICFMISSLKFQGRIRIKSGLASTSLSGVRIGICVPGRYLPCL